MNSRIEIIEGNIVKQRVDALVNAAKESLLGGGGVDGAVHAAAGPQLLEECRKLNGCATGEAKLTKGYNLPAKHIIHTVGPVWRGGKQREEELLAACYRNCLTLAAEQGLKTVALPSISTGLYRFPFDKAAKIALTEVNRFLEKDQSLEKVLFVCYGRDAYHTFLDIRTELGM